MSLSYDICYTARKIYQYLNKNLEEFGITPEQLVVLKKLKEEEGVSQKELALKVDKDQNTIKAIIDKLEKKEFLRREIKKDDKRVYLLFVTLKGKRLLKEVLEFEKKSEDDILYNLSEDKKKNLKEILEAIRDNLK